MKLRTAALPSLAAVALVAPAAAPGATLSVDKRCYAPGEQVRLSGGGYTPNGPVALSLEGRQLGIGGANSVGEFAAGVGAPPTRSKQRSYTYVATDQTDLSLTASAPVRVSSLGVRVTPRNGDPSKRKRIVARGFTSGKVLYAHVRRGKGGRNVKVGRLEGPCRTLTVKRRLFPSDAKPGVYRVSFDTRRRYRAKTIPQVSFVVTVFRTFRLAGASASANTGAGGWIRID